ncbi:MAG: right-handed parallel beta-helix repeat-containing protein [Deltaproteobacteria bacterium]|nr:right-handed parallel beta-helix repeat-containing protein [Deltaproteobacteria bacterium]
MLCWVLSVVLGCLGCGENEPDDCGEGACGGAAPTDPCPPPHRLLDGDRCLPPGVQDNGCAAGEHDPGDGSCLPAGIPPELCGTGFEPRDDGCEPVLPDEPCPSGTMALPGETACRPVAPCGSGPWGDIPVEPNTVYVDGSYTGGSSDGSAATPFVTVTEAIDAASPGAIVAVAEGSYPESLEITKSVRLWGVCPEKVELIGAAPDDRVLFVHSGGDGTEIRSLALTGARIGMLVAGVEDVVAAGLWVHDLAGMGFDIEGALGPASATVSDSLIEQVHDLGVYVSDTNVTLERLVIRDTQPLNGSWGRGIHVEHDNVHKSVPVVQIAEVLLERNHEIGLFSGGGDVTILDSVVRDTRPRPNTLGDGWGVAVRQSAATEAPSHVVVRGLYVANSHEVGLSIFGSQVTAEALTVRDTQPHALTGDYGLGVQVRLSDPDLPASAHLRASVIAHNHYVGVLVLDSNLIAEGIVIRDTQPSLSESIAGVGVDASNEQLAEGTPTVTVAGSRIEGNHYLGVMTWGCDATVSGTVVRDTSPQPSDGMGGAGIVVQMGARTQIIGSLVEDSFDGGILVFGAEATIENTVVSNSQPLDGLFGDGVVVAAAGSVLLSHSRVHRSARVGLGSWGSVGSLAQSELECNGIDLNVDPFHEVQGTLSNLGGNRCGCEGTERQCKALSAGIEPPEAPQ